MHIVKAILRLHKGCLKNCYFFQVKGKVRRRWVINGINRQFLIYCLGAYTFLFYLKGLSYEIFRPV
jgi:hypothetical protein